MKSIASADHQLLTLTTLLQLEKAVRQAETLERFGFVTVNETHRLVRYHQAVLWRNTAGGPRILAVSGLAQLDRNASYLRWLQAVLAHAGPGEPGACRPLERQELPDPLQADWGDHTPGHLLLCPLAPAGGAPMGGLLFTRAEPWNEAETGLLALLGEPYAHAWSALLPQERRWHRHLTTPLRRRPVQLAVLALLVAAGFLPVQLTALAPASVVPLDPLVVASPQDGVVEHVDVQPNQTVQAGQLLFRLDDTGVRNNLEVARKTLAVAEAEHMKAAQKAFADPRSKGEVALLKARTEQAAAEADYYAELLERIQMRAARAGIAVFSDPNDWLGRPVQVGEKVMTLADPERLQLEIRLPVADAINLEPGSGVRLFLNTDPTRPLQARLTQTSYEAEIGADEVLAFRLKAAFEEQVPPRIGLQGTAKVYGEQVRLYYYLFRRPVAAVRQWLGL